MNIIPQIIINSAEHVFVNKQEYQRLQDENINLRTKIRLLTNDYDKLDLIKQNHENTIDILRKENLLLKERIDILEKENKTLKQEIKDIKCELNDFKQKILNDGLN
jgi:cell division protein FtsB